MLKLTHITKQFGKIRAADDLSFDVPESSIFGFLGPNGAGKTTTMRMVLDIIRPDRGTITWRGEPITEEVRRRFGYLPEERGLYAKMRVGEQLLFFARLYGMEKRLAEKTIDVWLERFGIRDRKMSRLEELSRGNQQKVQVLTAIIHQPDLALLDEPFTGLDPINVELLERALVSLKEAGKTVIFSSHRLEQVEELCEEVAIIAKGRLRLTGNVERLRREGTRRIVQLRLTEGLVPDVSGLPLAPLESTREYFRYSVLDGADSQEVLTAVACRQPVEYLALERPSLQDIFLEVTQAAEPPEEEAEI